MDTERETKTSNLTKKDFTSFTEYEELAEQVKRLPCLYNESAKSYKERHVGNAWAVVASNLDFVEDVKYFQKQVIIGVLYKKVFLEISQSSQENTCDRGSFLMKLQAGLQLD